MPPTTEQIPDKSPFDVYAMMLILSFLFTAGATAFLNDDLTKNWGFWKDKSDKKYYVTQMNDKEETAPYYIKLRKEDTADAKITVTGYEWPEKYDPIAHPVLPNTDNLTAIPADELKALMEGYKGPVDSTEKPAEPKAETPPAATPPAATPPAATPPAADKPAADKPADKPADK